MSWFSLIETERLFVREYMQDDVESRVALMRESFESDYTLEQHRHWLDWTIASYREHGAMSQPPYGDYAVELKSSGEVIGSVGLVPQGVPWATMPEWRSPGEPVHALVTAEFGLFWAIRKAHRGQGYACEAAHAFMHQFMFNIMHVKRAVATTDHDNVGSQRVMEKLGMTLYRNPESEPFWFNVVGVLYNPALTQPALDRP